MVTIAEQIIKQAWKQAITPVTPIQPTQQTNQPLAPIEEDKGFFSSVWDLIKWVWWAVTKPSLANAVDPYWRWQDTWFKSDTKSDDINYIQNSSKSKDEAYSIMKQRGYITDEKKANETLDAFYQKNDAWVKKNVPELDPTQKTTALDLYQQQKEKERQNTLDVIQKKSYETASKNIWDFSALRAAQEQKDALDKLTWSTLASVVDIKKKQLKLQQEGKSNPDLDKAVIEAEKIQSYTTNRLAELASMQAKYWGDVFDNQKAVVKEIKSKWFANLNEFILQDVHKEMWLPKTGQSYMDVLLTRSAKADFEYQKSRDINSVWDVFSVVFNSIWDGIKVAETAVVNPLIAWAVTNALDFAFTPLWMGDAGTFAQADVSSLSTYEFSEWGISWLEKYYNKILWALPESLTFIASIWAWDKWVSKIANLTKVWALAWNVTLTWGYSYKLLKWMQLTDATALKAARVLDNVVYTVWNQVPKEVISGMVGNSFDPESWSKLQEHFWMLDVAFGWIWGVMRHTWLYSRYWIKNLNEILDTPEAAAKYAEKQTQLLSKTSLTPVEIAAFNASAKQILKAGEKLYWLVKAWEASDVAIDPAIIGMTSDQFNAETKKSFARSYVRELYIKKDWQLTDADRLLLGNLQKLVSDPKINVAEALKITYNVPWKISAVWFESSALTKADEMLRQLDFKYGKTVDDVFTIEWWKPDNILTQANLEVTHANASRTWMYKNLFIERADDTFIPNEKYFDEVIEDWDVVWHRLNSEGYAYLGIADMRKDAWQILSTNNEMTVTEAIRESARRTGDEIPEDFLQTLEATNLVDKLISLSWC